MLRASFLLLLPLVAANCSNVDESCHPENYPWINDCPSGTAPQTRIVAGRDAGGGVSLKETSAEGYYATDDTCEYACVPYGDGDDSDDSGS